MTEEETSEPGQSQMTGASRQAPGLPSNEGEALQQSQDRQSIGQIDGIEGASLARLNGFKDMVNDKDDMRQDAAFYTQLNSVSRVELAEMQYAIENDITLGRSDDPDPVLHSTETPAMLKNPTQDAQYQMHQGSRGISPPPGFDDFAVPSYTDSSRSIPAYTTVITQQTSDPPPTARSLDDHERDPMTDRFMNAHIARHGTSSLSPLALLTPDASDTLPMYVTERPGSVALDTQESSKELEATEAVRALEEREAVEQIRQMEAVTQGHRFSVHQLNAIEMIGDTPEDYYLPSELSVQQADVVHGAGLSSMSVQDDPSRSLPSALERVERNDVDHFMTVLQDRIVTMNMTSTGQPRQSPPTIAREPISLSSIDLNAEFELIPPGCRIDPVVFEILLRTGSIIQEATLGHKAEAVPQSEQIQTSYGGGHGVKRTYVSSDVYEAQQSRNAKKAIEYIHLAENVNKLRGDADYSQEAFDLTTTLLMINPEYYTIWNYRREIMLQGLFVTQDDVKRQDLLKSELKRSQTILRDWPKVYWIWNHRKWCLSQCPWPDWASELLLVTKMLERDARNFHVWEYRRYVVSRAEMVDGASKALREFEYTTAAINSNFSNFSAWHNRTKLIPQMLASVESQEERELMRSSMLRDEFELIKGAIYTDPDDQSVWLYHRWLCNPESASATLHPLSPTSEDDHVSCLQNELDMIDELMEEEPENVWCVFAKVTYSLSLHRLRQTPGNLLQSPSIRALVNFLAARDTLRRGRYLAWLEAGSVTSHADIVELDLIERGWSVDAKSDVVLHATGHDGAVYQVYIGKCAESALSSPSLLAIVKNGAVTYHSLTSFSP